jgi:hypothetical protein
MTALLLAPAPNRTKTAPEQQPKQNCSDTGWPPRSSPPGPSGPS